MDLQKTLTVCLLSFFASTLVVLIARSLDTQAASRIEPQLIRIAEQLEAINARSGGALSSNAIAATSQPSSDPVDKVVVNYFYSNTRCQTCRAIESQTHDVLTSQFAEQLDNGNVQWKTFNYEDPRHAELMQTYEILMPVVVVTRVENGNVTDWKRLDEVWGVVKDSTAFAALIQAEVDRMLHLPLPVDSNATASIPLPE